MLQLTSTGAAFLVKNKHVEMEQTILKNGEKQPTEALSIAKPLALILLDSPFADTLVKLAETSATGSALVMAVIAYATRVIMATMMEKMVSEGGADMSSVMDMMQAMMVGAA